MTARRLPSVQLAQRLQELPHSVEAEQAVLGACLHDPAAYSQIATIVTPADFYRADHRVIFGRIAAMADGGDAADAVTLAQSLEGYGQLENVGGRPYIDSLVLNSCGSVNVLRYAEIVVEHARRRDTLAALVEATGRLQSPGADFPGVRTEVVDLLLRLEERRQRSDAMDWHNLGKRTPPDRVWDVYYWIPSGHIVLLIGIGGVGKSTFAQLLASCLVLGIDCIDRIDRRHVVLFWACEDDRDEIWRKQAAIATHYKVALSDFEQLHIEPRIGRDNVLFEETANGLRFTSLLTELVAKVRTVGAQVVILDGIAQIYGAKENDRHHVTVFLNGLAGALPGVTIIILGHPAKLAGSEYSGSTAWENAVRTRLHFGWTLPDSPDHGDVDEDVRYLSKRKANYSNRDWRRLTYRNGVLVPDAVEVTGGMVAHLRDQQTDRVVLAGIEKLAQQGLHGTDTSNSGRYLPRLLAEYKLHEGRSKTDLAAAMRRLQMAGKIVRATVGTYGNRSKKEGLVIAQECTK